MLKEVWRLHGQQWDEFQSQELTEEFLHWSKALTRTQYARTAKMLLQ